ncbi:MAG: hypothetical protein ACTSRR_06615 [Candidatus Heimdallarchaeaceae archaeon]
MKERRKRENRIRETNNTIWTFNGHFCSVSSSRVNNQRINRDQR